MTASRSQRTVKAKDVVRKVSLPVAGFDQNAITNLHLQAKVTSHKLDEEVRENKWRRDAINRLLWAFYVLNGLILLFIAAVWWREATVEGAPHIVTERLLLTLVGASTVQLGALAGFVGRSLAKRS